MKRNNDQHNKNDERRRPGRVEHGGKIGDERKDIP